MHDEATPLYQDIIENMRMGFEFLEREFNGYKPKIAWQIDTFGHSQTNARIFADFEFEAMVIARMDY